MFYGNVWQALYSSFPSLFSGGLRETLFTFLLLLLSAGDTWGLFLLRGTTPKEGLLPHKKNRLPVSPIGRKR